MLRELVVFLALTSAALAAVSLAPLEPKPDKYKNVEGCYVAMLDKVIPIDQSAPCTMHCMEYRCRSTNMQIASCVKVGRPPSGCKLEEDNSKSYPDCCPKIVCP